MNRRHADFQSLLMALIILRNMLRETADIPGTGRESCEGDMSTTITKNDLQAAVQEERDRCICIVQAARSGDIDTDFRTLIHFMDSGYQMRVIDDEFVSDNEMADRELRAKYPDPRATP